MFFLRCAPFALVYSLALAADPRGDNPSAQPVAAGQQRTLFHVPAGFEVQLVADESDIQKPLNLNFDSAGRLWVTGSELYPWPARTDALGQSIASFEKNWSDNGLAFRAASLPPTPVERGTDTVRVLSDFDPTTGRARTISIFADGLNIPIGILPLPRRPGAKGDTIIVHSIPAIWRLEDTDGDGRADKRERLYSEFGFKDTHGMVSNFTYWVDGWIYGTHGFANHSEVRDRTGNLTVLDSGNTYRFRPDGSHFEQWTHGQTNPFGLAFDARGDVFTADSHSKPVYLLVHGGYYEGISKQHDGLGFAPSITLDDHGSSAIAGIACYTATQFPAEYRGNLFNGNPVTRRINRDRLEWMGSTPKAIRMADFLTCDDPSFRPVQVKLGPDGALWIADFYNPIIGHYEVPLTHPNRDHAHGRIWRIVWHGEDNSVLPPALPDFSHANASELVAKLRDDNLVVRTLATNELVDRVGATDAVPALRAATEKSAPLQVAFALERLGASDDERLFAPLGIATTDSDSALSALRVLAGRKDFGSHGEKFFSDVLARTMAGHLWRAIADLFATHPQNWQGPLLLSMLARTPDTDLELVYALRLALKAFVAGSSIEELNRLVAGRAEDAERIADVSVAVAQPIAADFLLAHLERTQFAGARAGEFARHAVLQLPASRFDAIEPVVNALAHASATQRLPLAEGLASASVLPGRKLPDTVSVWMQHTLVECFTLADGILARRAVDATKDLPFPEKNPPLREIILNAKAYANVRTAAIRAVAVDAEGVATLTTLLNRTSEPIALRRAAVEQLSLSTAGPNARAALKAALPSAQIDLALLIATGLAKTDSGAEDLIGSVEAGRAPASLLRHRYVATELEKRPATLRSRAAGLTRNLPTEDARLDAIIAQRSAAFGAAKPNAAHGADVFKQNCTSCHRLKSVGGNLGPSLDGISSRTVQRLIEDILDPNRNVDPVFRLASVTLKSGEIKSGLNLREQTDQVAFTDPATGLDVMLERGTVATTAQSAMSPMPAAFESILPEADFYDLIEYLRAPPAK